MNPLTAINTAIFAIVFSLFALETGAALLNLISYRDYGKKLEYYIARSWAASTTFIVFYVVNFEAAYPLLLAAAGTLYLAPVLFAGMCIIFRNAFIAYSDYAGDESSKGLYTRVYSIATLLAVLVLVSALSSTVTGSGVNLSALTISYLPFFVNPYNILMFVCAAAVSLVGALTFFGIERPLGLNKVAALGALVVIVLVTFLAATFGFAPQVAQGLSARWYYLVPALLLLVASAFMYIKDDRRVLGVLTFLWLFTSVAGFEALGHPQLFGGALSIDSFLTSSAGESASIAITSATTLVLLVGIGLLLYAHNKSKGAQSSY